MWLVLSYLIHILSHCFFIFTCQKKDQNQDAPRLLEHPHASMQLQSPSINSPCEHVTCPRLHNDTSILAYIKTPPAQVSGQSQSSGGGGSIRNTSRNATMGTGLQQHVSSTASTYNLRYFQQWQQMVEGTFNVPHVGLGPVEPSSIIVCRNLERTAFHNPWSSCICNDRLIPKELQLQLCKSITIHQCQGMTVDEGHQINAC